MVSTRASLCRLSARSAPDTGGPPRVRAVVHDLDEARACSTRPGWTPRSLSIELMAYNDRPEFGDLAAVIQDELASSG